LRPFKGLTRGQVDAQRIDLFAIDMDLVVKVRAGGISGAADIADDLSLADPGAGGYAAVDAAEMRIGRRMPTVMADADVSSIAAIPARRFDDAVAGGVDRRAGGRCEVGASMQAIIPRDRMPAHAEA